eukprot:scaffold12381_cov63-Phaeocystis_antarctica.AAC.4
MAETSPIGLASAAHEADWPRLAGAWGSLRHPLALVRALQRVCRGALWQRDGCSRRSTARRAVQAAGGRVAEYLQRMTARPAWVRAQREQLVKDAGVVSEMREPLPESDEIG